MTPHSPAAAEADSRVASVEPMSAFPITDFEPRQADEVVRLWRASFEHGVGITDHHPIADQLRFFVEEVVPNARVRVVSDGPAIVGFLAARPESVSHLYVKVEKIGRGIGSRLLALAKEESCGRLWLYTFARNSNARRFYERHGFREVERECENMWKLEAIKYQWVRGGHGPFAVDVRRGNDHGS